MSKSHRKRAGVPLRETHHFEGSVEKKGGVTDSLIQKRKEKERGTKERL